MWSARTHRTPLESDYQMVMQDTVTCRPIRRLCPTATVCTHSGRAQEKTRKCTPPFSTRVKETPTMAKLKSLDDLLVHELQDIYHAEGQILKALPKMIKAANHPELQAA